MHQTEFYFGGGISSARAGTTVYGRPVKVIELGYSETSSVPVCDRQCLYRETHLPLDVIHDLVADLRHRFSEWSYSLLSNNCNNFTDELSKLLVGTGIPVRQGC